MKIIDAVPLSSAMPDVQRLRYARFADERGYFTETARPEQIAALPGFENFHIAQINESRSVAGVARGLHIQWSPFMGKLVRVVDGHLIDIACDLRKGSPTFGRVVACELRHDREDSEPGEWVWLPPGFGHGVLFPTVASRIEYLCTSAWSPATEACIALASSELDWSLVATDLAARAKSAIAGASFSDKDRVAPTLAAWLDDPRSDQVRWSPGSPWSCA
ncbi:MAG: dTDP-4-dehydrorhamnose 3,5-epimerase family protein [Planctomycetota bacterium]